MQRWRQSEGGSQHQFRYLARQPILDRYRHIYAYELLFRNATEEQYQGGDPDQVTRTMLDNLVLYGLDKITAGKTAFVNCTLEALTGNLVDVLPPSTTVLEILETVEPSPDLADACLKLKAKGYRIALDDFRFVPGIEPLVAIADYIKIDFLQSGKEERMEILQRLKGSSATLLAEKIESSEEFDLALHEGCTLFQGYHFCHPEIIRNRDIPANCAAQLKILGKLQQKTLDFQELGQLVERDPALSYRLLRMLNSAAFGLRGEIRSIEKALVTIGENHFRRIAMLAIASTLNCCASPELLRLALARARFCELGATLTRQDPGEQYLLGLFSLLPAMLQIPMQELLTFVALRSEIRDALAGQPIHDAQLLRWIEAFELADWSACDHIARNLQIGAEQLQQCGLDAMNWADTTLQTAP